MTVHKRGLTTREIDIFEMVIRGEALVSVGAKYGVSGQRVTQLVERVARFTRVDLRNRNESSPLLECSPRIKWYRKQSEEWLSAMRAAIQNFPAITDTSRASAPPSHWPFATAEQHACYEALRAQGYAVLREAHELFQAAVREKKS